MSLTWMMWLDGDPRKAQEIAIEEAIEYYKEKYGVKPNRVQIPLELEEISVEGVLIERKPCVLKKHILVTMDKEVDDLRGTNGEESVRK